MGSYGFSRRCSSASIASRMNLARPYVPTSASMRSTISGASRIGVGFMFNGGLPMRRPVAAVSASCKKTIPFSVDAINGTDYINGIENEHNAPRQSRRALLGVFPMFVLSAPFVKTAREWAALAPRRSVDRAARAYAKANMVAVVLCGDDSAVSYMYDVANDRIARTVHHNVEWVA